MESIVLGRAERKLIPGRGSQVSDATLTVENKILNKSPRAGGSFSPAPA